MTLTNPHGSPFTLTPLEGGLTMLHCAPSFISIQWHSWAAYICCTLGPPGRRASNAIPTLYSNAIPTLNSNASPTQQSLQFCSKLTRWCQCPTLLIQWTRTAVSCLKTRCTAHIELRKTVKILNWVHFIFCKPSQFNWRQFQVDFNLETKCPFNAHTGWGVGTEYKGCL